MSSFLAGLPHQIPFRAASAARRIDASTVEGTFLVTACDALCEGLAWPVMVVEAMAQVAGEVAFGDTGEKGYLSAIDQAHIDGPFEPGDLVTLRATLEASFGGVHRFSASATMGEAERARARFYLTSAAKDA